MNRYATDRQIYDALDVESLLPDPPENPEFNELFTEAEQTRMTERFNVGITRHEQALYEARKRQAAREARMHSGRKRKAEREAQALAGRFNPVLRSRP